MRLFVIGMLGAGNLGDDLISVLLLKQINERWPGAEVGVLHSGFSNPFSYHAPKRMHLLEMPRRRSWQTYFGRLCAVKDFALSSDLILVGGGGLFQDSHSRFTVHKWLRDVLCSSGPRIPAAAVGVGFGPLNHSLSRWYLKQGLARFSTIQVRDKKSENVVRSLGYPATIAPDIVAGADLGSTPFRIPSKRSGDTTVGCSIRPWPGMDFSAMTGLVRRSCTAASATAKLFVFEHAEPDNTSEYDYALAVASQLSRSGIAADVICYRKDPIEDFTKAFASVSMAIASRYHANILWQKLGVPVLPVPYAPKVASLYEEHSLSVFALDELDLADVSTHFKKIDLSESYSLPSDAELYRVGDFRPLYLKSLAAGMGVGEVGYGVLRSLAWRFQASRKDRRHRPFQW